MRTRDEQISELVDALKKPVCRPDYPVDILNLWLEKHLLEAEQRVRAEIGRDSERLDWLERQFKSCTVYMNGECSFSPSPVMRNLKGHSFRQAIDAAREVG